MIKPTLEAFESMTWGGIARVGMAAAFGVGIFLCVTGKPEFGVGLLGGTTLLAVVANGLSGV